MSALAVPDIGLHVLLFTGRVGYTLRFATHF